MEVLVLGVVLFILFEMVCVYVVFDNGGFLIDFYIIECIEDS